LARRIARLLAEREHRLRDQLVREKWQTPEAKERTTQLWLGRLEVLHVENKRLDALCGVLRADLDAARAEVARLEALCTEQARLIVERDAARARIAELEASEPNVLLQRAYSLACNERGLPPEEYCVDYRAREMCELLH
jgi:hypothetical protein